MAVKGSALDNGDGGSAFSGPRLILAAVIGFMALTLGACGTGEASTPASTGTDGSVVVIEDLAFEPETLTVEVGDTVTWTWMDGAIAHDVAGDDFQSEAMSEGSFRHRFDEPGTYEYVCTLHPNMTGTIEVTN
jgi:plastocyanin